MSTLQINRDEEKDRRKGLLISIAVHAGIILLALLPLLTYQDPPPGQEGVLISFGNIDQGSGDDRPDVQQEEYVEVPTEEAVPEDVPEPVEAAEAAKPVEKKVMTVDDSEIKIRKQKELEAAQAEAEERILLTRDRELLMHRRVVHGRYLRAQRTEDQLRDVVGRFGL
ncbi:MAG TPA: Mut7-C RNAse domain-containing protein, partial [Saprospiraceae bacterium]|nr:Mut7-C RNAse domain-containing protein [Saprospiraceae bacterium]